MKPNTRLTLENEKESVLNATYELTLSNGESVRLNFLLEKQSESLTPHQVELAMLRRVKELAEHMLKA